MAPSRKVPTLAVPYIYQSSSQSNLCVPICLKMVLEYEAIYLTKIVRNAGVPNLTVHDIAGIIKTTSEGTLFPDVPLINAPLRNATPPLEFSVDLHYRKFEDILQQLRKEQPVIPFLQMDDGVHSYGHTVVVRGFDETAQVVLVNDPLDKYRKPSTVPTTEFMTAWDGGDRWMLKVKIGEQKRLTDDYIPSPKLEVPNLGGT